MRNTFSRFLIFLLIPIIIYVIYLAICWGIADVYYRPAMNQLRDWAKGNIELEINDWENLRIKLNKALSFDPDNPDIHENLALAIEGRYSKAIPGDAEAEVFRELALNHYRESIKLRPVWPYSWSNLALVKYRLRRIDDEFFLALHNAEKLGRWEPAIQRMVTDIGLSLWLKLSEQQRIFIWKAITHSLEKQPKETLEIVKKHGYLDIVCLVNKDKPLIVKQCNKLSKK